MNKLISILLIAISINVSAKKDDIDPQVWLKSSSIDNTLTENQAVYEFNFAAPEKDHRLIYTIDGHQDTSDLVKGALRIQTTPGKHIFQFYYSQDYEEISTDSLVINPHYVNRYTVIMYGSQEPIIDLKPIIYLYPTMATEVTVKLTIKGEDQFYYPAYNDQWKFLAYPNGDLVFGEKTYNYLFWEAPVGSEIITNDGFVVAGKNSTTFLERKLSEIGFTPKEQADFITFWAPKLQQNEFNFIQFIVNDACDQYALMDIFPKPNNLYRIRMLWSIVDGSYQAQKQELPKINRTGFSVLEWGGQQTRFRRINCTSYNTIAL